MPLKYPPILSARGMGHMDDRHIGCRGHIPEALEARVERIYYSRSYSNFNL